MTVRTLLSYAGAILPVAAIVVAAAAASLLTMPVRSAFACTPTPNYHRVTSSDLIVEGRVLDWQETGGLGLTYRIDVSRAFKGSGVAAGDVITVHDSGSRDRGEWIAGGGLCGTFGSDPEGLHLVVGLARGDGGELRSNTFSRFFLGPDASGQAYDEAISEIEAGTPPAPPATGTGSSSSSPTPLAGALLAIVVVATAAAISLRSRGR